jgi:hypothetical protein
MEFTEAESAARSTAAGNAVLAGIAAADVLCIIHLGIRSVSTKHSDAVEILRRFDTNAAADLAVLVRDKSQAHYGVTAIDTVTVTRILRSMERLVARATEAAAKISPR